MVVESFVQIRVIDLIRFCWTSRKVVTSLVARSGSPDGYGVNLNTHGDGDEENTRDFGLACYNQRPEVALTSNLIPSTLLIVGHPLNGFPSPDAHIEPSNSKILHLHQPFLARTDFIIS